MIQSLKGQLFFWATFVLIMQGCKTTDQPKEQTNRQVPDADISFVVEGNYVTSEYSKRNEGYDWMAVTVSKLTDSAIHVKIRSRVDQKKPSCTFDANAKLLSNNQYKTIQDGKGIVFTFTKSSIEISSDQDSTNNMLMYYCSGGGTIGGTYLKLEEPLEDSQLDKRVFVKFLSMNNTFFEVSTTGEGSIQQLKITPFGLKIDNKEINMEIDGFVTDAGIADLNADGFPEILVFTSSAGSGGYGNVIGYTVHNGKTLSNIYFPSISDNKEGSKGYMGHDEFAIVENSLVQRFKTYNQNDINSTPTGTMRQLQYKLIKDKDGYKFEMYRMTEFPE